ncbi:hypothetical protein [Streptomyces sp. NPDC002328]|uniref:hypothetical protein n=1 Tax=Streptomyces sp. NPDC002328 TaxID=3364642 RepID=UPI0036B77DD0
MSRVPDLIDALTARLATEEGLSDVRVADGPEVSEEGADEWILIGYDGDPESQGQAAVTEEDWAALGTSRSERIELPVTILVRRGDTEVRAARARVYAIGAVVRRVLVHDPSVGLTGMQAAIAGTALFQAQTTDGIQDRLVLTVGVQAFT